MINRILGEYLTVYHRSTIKVTYEIEMENLEEYYNDIKTTSFDLETIFKFCPDGIVCKDSD